MRADDDAIGEHVEVVIVPLAGRSTRRSALEDQVVLIHLAPTLWPSVEGPPPRLGDLHIRDLAPVATGNHALGICGREAGTDQLNHLRDCEAMREHDCLGAAITAGSKQFKGATASSCRPAVTTTCRHYSETY
jgi:hypothetical protein